MKQDIEIINQANNDHFDLLEDNALDLIRGGAVKCKENYSLGDNGTVKCGCGYSNSASLNEI